MGRGKVSWGKTSFGATARAESGSFWDAFGIAEAMSGHGPRVDLGGQLWEYFVAVVFGLSQGSTCRVKTREKWSIGVRVSDLVPSYLLFSDPFDTAASTENAPAPEIMMVRAMAAASRWYSNPSPFWAPVQSMKNPT
jgi:hypothetical protein